MPPPVDDLSSAEHGSPSSPSTNQPPIIDEVLRTPPPTLYNSDADTRQNSPYSPTQSSRIVLTQHVGEIAAVLARPLSSHDEIIIARIGERLQDYIPAANSEPRPGIGFVSPESRDRALAQAQANSNQGIYPPSNTPSSDFSLSPISIRRRRAPTVTATAAASTNTVATSVNMAHVTEIDYQALTYVDKIDENLICSICRNPFHTPVTTTCDHTFCSACINQALDGSSICPVDRRPVNRDATINNQSSQVIRNLVDNLKVECPLCEKHFARATLQAHLDRYCQEALVQCPGQNTTCLHKIKRVLLPQGCLHYPAKCPHCEEFVQMNNMEVHESEECTEKMESCEHCKEVLLRCDMQSHDDQCPDMVIKCKWAKYKCPFESKRKDMHLHAQECKVDAVGSLADMLVEKVNNLQDENRTMQEKIELQNRRLRSFEFDRVPDHGPPMDLSELPNHPRYTGSPNIDPNNVPARPSLEWLISLSDSQETKILQLQNAMSEMEARQSTLVYNETIGIKNTITEMRSNLQTMNMYVRWLVQWRQQEIRQHGGNRPSPSGNGGSSGGEGGSGGERRLSDLTREMTRL